MEKFYYWYKVIFWEDGIEIERTGLMCAENFSQVAENITGYYGEDSLDSLEVKYFSTALEFENKSSFEDTQKLFVI